MIPIKKNLRRIAETNKIISCPYCHRQHKWGICGNYCAMTCYYSELRQAGVYDGGRHD